MLEKKFDRDEVQIEETRRLQNIDNWINSFFCKWF